MGRKRKPLTDLFPEDTATIEWLQSQSKSTKGVYASLWQWFLEFTNMNGNQILEDRKQDEEHKWERKALEFTEWCLTHTCESHKKPLSESAQQTALGAVRGFFNFHYVDLKFRNSVKKRLAKKPKRLREDYLFSKKDIATMATQANLRDRYILVVGKSLGLRAVDFINLRVGNFTALDLEQEAPISMGRVYTVKEGVPAYPFLDSDAIPVVKAYLRTIDTNDPDKPMLDFKKSELTNVLQRLAKKARINIGNKHLRFHCLRKFLIDRLSAVMSESKWKQIVGKQISESAYVSEAQLKEAYKRAMKETIFNNANHSAIKNRELEEAIKKLQQDVNAYKTVNETLAKELGFITQVKRYLEMLLEQYKQLAKIDPYPQAKQFYNQQIQNLQTLLETPITQ